MNKILKKSTILLFLIFSVLFKINAQDTLKIKPSIYLGWGLGANIGGYYGLGSELRFNKRFSFNVAGGACPTISGKYIFDYDLGFKYYLINYLFFGMNYGLIDFETYTSEEGDINKSTKGVSISGGFRTMDLHNLYLSGYLGVNTDLSCSNSGFLGNSCILRFGIMLGCTFN